MRKAQMIQKCIPTVVNFDANAQSRTEQVKDTAQGGGGKAEMELGVCV
jgi:hypothetical protein